MSTPAAKRRQRRATPFYVRAVEASDAEVLELAAQLQDVDNEIAVLRLRIARLLAESPVDDRVLQGAMRVLLQAVATRHRLSTEQVEAVQEAVIRLLHYFRRVMFVEET